MKHSKLWLFTLLICGLSACQKDKGLRNQIDKTFTITGQVYEDCLLTKPYANGKIQITNKYTVDEEQPSPFEEIIDSQTDADGRFSFSFKGNVSNELYITPKDGYSAQLPVWVNKDVGKANLFDTNTYVTFVVKTSQPYANATLNITTYGIFDLKGPFTNGQELFKLEPFFGFYWDRTHSQLNGAFQYSFVKGGGRFNYNFNLCTKNQLIEVDLDKL